MNSLTGFLNTILGFLLQLLTLIIDFFVSMLMLLLHFAQTIVGMAH